MKNNFFIIMLAALLFSCSAESRSPVFVTTNQPLAFILSEIVGTRAKVECLLSAGASPHTYEPRPSDMTKAQYSLAVFFVSDMLDGWAMKMPGKNKISVINFIPDEYLIRFSEMNGNPADTAIDPHFWMDPLTVKALLPALIDTLSRLSPDDAATFRENGELFAKRLDLIDRQTAKTLENVRGSFVFSFHPSMNYLIKRYGLVYAGSLEDSPGKEPTPKKIETLVERIKKSGTKAIFSEPQLPLAPAKAIADAAGVLIFELDPLGGTAGRDKYSSLINYNARTLQRALE